MKTYEGKITKLKANQVFVFGSNWNEKTQTGGFHGAGSAGFASFGESGNVWRKFDYANKQKGWKGKWNVKGEGLGLQEGTEGKSYALPTITHAGAKQSLSKEKIKEYIKDLYAYASNYSDLEFLIAYRDDGSRLLNGYSVEDMAEMFSAFPIPENIVFEDQFSKIVERKINNDQTR